MVPGASTCKSKFGKYGRSHNWHFSMNNFLDHPKNKLAHKIIDAITDLLATGLHLAD